MIGIWGAGKMGEAMARGWIQQGTCAPESLLMVDVDEERLGKIRESLDVLATTPDQVTSKSPRISTWVIAVKPTQAEQVLAELKKLAPDLVISIAAGLRIKNIEASLQSSARVLRAMPNTPAQCGAGITAIARGSQATTADVTFARELFAALGSVLELPETQFDAVTALSGSGPAYMFLVLEALADGGVSQGLPREAARLIAAHTMRGSAELALQQHPIHTAELKDQVASPAGTTIAALEVLERNGVRGSFMQAIAAATRRSKDLSD